LQHGIKYSLEKTDLNGEVRMCKSYIFIFLILIFFTSCGKKELTQTAMHEPEETHAYEISSHENETYDCENFFLLVESGENFRVVQPYEESPWHLRYEIFNNNGESIFREETHRPAHLKYVSDDILEYIIYVTGVSFLTFYSQSGEILSENISNAFFLKDRLVAHFGIDHRNDIIIVQDIFDPEIFYREFFIGFCSEFGPSMVPYVEINYLGNDEFEISCKNCEINCGRNRIINLTTTRDSRDYFAEIIAAYADFERSDFWDYDMDLIGETIHSREYHDGGLFTGETRLSFGGTPIMYYFFDINGDGVPELFIGMENRVEAIFALQNGIAVPVISSGSHTELGIYIDIFNNNFFGYFIRLNLARMGRTYDIIFTLDENGNLIESENIISAAYAGEHHGDWDFSNISYYRYLDGENIFVTEEEFNEFLTRYRLHEGEWILNFDYSKISE